MDFNLEIPRNHLFIHSISDAGIRVGDVYYDGPLVISGQQIVPDWNVGSMADLNEESLQLIFAMQPELVIIGCGNSQVFLPPATQALFIHRNIGFEVMITDAACRTFNVLVNEGRNVVAALLPNP